MQNQIFAFHATHFCWFGWVFWFRFVFLVGFGFVFFGGRGVFILWLVVFCLFCVDKISKHQISPLSAPHQKKDRKGKSGMATPPLSPRRNYTIHYLKRSTISIKVKCFLRKWPNIYCPSLYKHPPIVSATADNDFGWPQADL